jgi:hypothetical protein
MTLARAREVFSIFSAKRFAGFKKVRIFAARFERNCV